MRVSPPLLQRFFLSLPFTLRLRFPPLGDPRLLNPQSQQPRLGGIYKCLKSQPKTFPRTSKIDSKVALSNLGDR
jgi:hypothetical protein